MARSPKDVKSRGLGLLMLLDVARWEEKTGKAGEKRKSIKVGDKSLERFAKTSAKLQKRGFSK